ncbi:MAG: sulfite exporter TauE/SafE family protein [Solirubrobacterales bacterium]|nr:sulfite exporter TauE/SafE family protein [Solirubrobacterales bacterium]MBV9364931.1 sulfite exporter TauE/SafE family protein [Solirubrobacterales bacterium]
MSPHFTLLAAVLLGLLGFAIGVFGTLVGAGGGFILTPVLLLVYPQTSPALITAISLIVVFFNAGSGSVAYARQKRIDYRSGSVFALCTLPGAVVGVLVADKVSRPGFDVIMGVALTGLAWWLVRGRGQPQGGHVDRGAARTITDREGNLYRYRVNVRIGALFSVAVGFVSSFLGIGGGVVHVPVLVTVLGFPTHVATATSHFVLAWMALVATLTHVAVGTFHGAVGLRRSAALSVGVVLGAQLGAVLSQRVSGTVIHRLLAVALFALGARLALSVVL